MDDMEFTDKDMLADHIAGMVDLAVEKHGDKPSFTCILPTGHNHTISFKELGHYSDAVAVYLREALKLVPGDVVAIQAPNVLAYPIVAFGVFKAGLIATNINPLYTIDETQHQLKDSGAKVWFVVDVFGDRVKQSVAGSQIEHVFKLSLVDRFPALPRCLLSFALRYIKKAVPAFNYEASGTLASVLKKGEYYLAQGVDVKSYRGHAEPDDVAIYQYTGGTTGRSKGAELTHKNVVANISQANKRGDTLQIGEQDTMLLILPLYHVYALAVGALNSMYTGCHIVLVPAPRPLENLRVAFEKFDITVLPGINTLYLGLLKEEWFTSAPPKALRYCIAGAAPLQPATSKAWKQVTGADIYEGYGLTEGTCVISVMPMNKPPKAGSCGRPIPGTQVRIVNDEGKDTLTGEPGELWLKGPQIMKGYLHNQEATAAVLQDGWLKTGDVAVQDEEGYLFIVDRMKDLILVSGFNVYPADIETVLTHYDKIAEAAVVGVPDQTTGEKVVAYIVKAQQDITEAEIIAHCKEHLTPYKLPKVIHFIDELPKSPVGKVLRRELRATAIAEN